MLINASPELFGLEESFDYLTHPFSLAGVFRDQEYTKWRTLRNHPDARFSITLPRVLLRPPIPSVQTLSAGWCMTSAEDCEKRRITFWGRKHRHSQSIDPRVC